MNVSNREADLIRLKKYYEPKRKRAIILFFIGIFLLLLSAIFFFFIGDYSYFILIPGFILTSFGAYSRRLVQLNIEKVGTRLNELRTKEEQEAEKRKTKKIGKYHDKLNDIPKN
jgi:hypothetical protein